MSKFLVINVIFILLKLCYGYATYDYCLVGIFVNFTCISYMLLILFVLKGAGPAGLQLGYFLQDSNRNYVIFERNNISGKHNISGEFFDTQNIICNIAF